MVAMCTCGMCIDLDLIICGRSWLIFRVLVLHMCSNLISCSPAVVRFCSSVFMNRDKATVF